MSFHEDQRRTSVTAADDIVRIPARQTFALFVCPFVCWIPFPQFESICVQMRIRDKLHKKEKKKPTDPYYTARLSLRTLPVQFFLSDKPRKWVLPITSINEDVLLMRMGVRAAERSQIEGLAVGQSSAASDDNGFMLTEEQLTSRAIYRLALDPPPAVGNLQRRTVDWLLRP